MASAAAPTAQTGDFARARRAMIDSQLRTSGINEPYLLDAIARVPREDFVPASARAVAYNDRQIPLGGGRVMTAPLSQARLLLEAKPALTDKVLLIGGGSGYLAAVLAPLVASLDVVESDDALAAMAPVKAGNWHSGDLAGGWKKGAPYDLVIIDGAAEQVPPAIAKQMAEDGRMITGTVTRGVTRIAVGRRVDNSVVLDDVADISMPVLAEFAAPKGWSF